MKKPKIKIDLIILHFSNRDGSDQLQARHRTDEAELG